MIPIQVDYEIVAKDSDEPKSEVGCYLCGCMWFIGLNATVTRPICPECGGCKHQDKHLTSLLYEGAEENPDAQVGNVSGAMLAKDSEELCPEDNLCTTASLDTFTFMYDSKALEAVGVFTPWHNWGEIFCSICRTILDDESNHDTEECLSNMYKRYIEVCMRFNKTVEEIVDRFTAYIKESNKGSS